MPEFLNAIPVGDLTTLEQVAQLMRLCFVLCLFADIEIELGVVEIVSRVDTSCLNSEKMMSKIFHIYREINICPTSFYLK